MECKIDDFTESGIIDITTNLARMVEIWNKAQFNYKRAFSYLEEINTLIEHIHKQHLHPLYPSHDAQNLSNNDKEGSIAGCPLYSPIDLLLREIIEVVDLDNNKLKYGNDFIFYVNDPDVPRAIKNNQTQQEIRFGRYKDQFKTFFDYFNFFKIQHRCTPTNPVNKLVTQLLLGTNPDNPNSELHVPELDELGNEIKDIKKCSDRVYGKDFIIDPKDPDKPQELVELEKTLNIPDNILKIKYSEYLKECTDPEEEEKDVPNEVKKNKKQKESCSYICTRLVGEWLHSTDIDGNGLIYGTDFLIRTGDPNKCRCLLEIEEDLDWDPPHDIMIISWDQFCNTFPNGNPDDRYK